MHFISYFFRLCVSGDVLCSLERLGALQQAVELCSRPQLRSFSDPVLLAALALLKAAQAVRAAESEHNCSVQLWHGKVGIIREKTTTKNNIVMKQNCLVNKLWYSNYIYLKCLMCSFLQYSIYCSIPSHLLNDWNVIMRQYSQSYSWPAIMRQYSQSYYN